MLISILIDHDPVSLLGQISLGPPDLLPDHLRKEKLLTQQCCRILPRNLTCLYVEMLQTENPLMPPRPPSRTQPPPEPPNSLPDL